MSEVKSDTPSDAPVQGSDADELPAPPECACIRTKMQYVMPEGSWGRHSSTAQFWCLQTMTSIGPDERPVHPETCHRGRTCFEEEA